jgi:hypothetical protein
MSKGFFLLLVSASTYSDIRQEAVFVMLKIARG